MPELENNKFADKIVENFRASMVHRTRKGHDAVFMYEEEQQQAVDLIIEKTKQQLVKQDPDFKEITELIQFMHEEGASLWVLWAPLGQVGLADTVELSHLKGAVDQKNRIVELKDELQKRRTVQRWTDAATEIGLWSDEYLERDLVLREVPKDKQLAVIEKLALLPEIKDHFPPKYITHDGKVKFIGGEVPQEVYALIHQSLEALGAGDSTTYSFAREVILELIQSTTENMKLTSDQRKLIGTKVFLLNTLRNHKNADRDYAPNFVLHTINARDLQIFTQMAA